MPGSVPVFDGEEPARGVTVHAGQGEAVWVTLSGSVSKERETWSWQLSALFFFTWGALRRQANTACKSPCWLSARRTHVYVLWSAVWPRCLSAACFLMMMLLSSPWISASEASRAKKRGSSAASQTQTAWVYPPPFWVNWITKLKFWLLWFMDVW